MTRELRRASLYPGASLHEVPSQGAAETQVEIPEEFCLLVIYIS